MEMNDPTERHYLEEMSKIIIDAVPDGDYTATAVASLIHERLMAEDEDLLTGWLRVQAVSIIAQAVGARRSHRLRQAVRQAPSAFQRAVTASQELGSSEPLSVFCQAVAINADRTVRPIGKLTREDCQWVSEAANKRAQTAAFESSFYAALAKKIPAGKVLEDVMSEVEFLRLRESLTQL